MAFEYFDVPFRYNETFIKLIFQNPYTLYAFWDISDEDEQKYIEEYGEHSYYNSRIYLEILNLTNGNFFEIDVNPFAKSWFIHIYEPNCKYVAKLCRTINNEKIDISASNALMVPTSEPHFPTDTNFTFVNNKTNEVAFSLSIPSAINAMNMTGSYNLKFDGQNNITFVNRYIEDNPSSNSHISSGAIYFTKEDVNE